MIGGRSLDVITGSMLKNMLLVAAHNLEQQKDIVNALNVFPVPDGDTGTNMSLTLNAAVKELENANGDDIGRLTSLLARGSLMGARGNSGVILSQFFRGFSKGLAKVNGEATGADLARAFVVSSETTYRAVMKPVEGTMLTVGRKAGEAAQEAAEQGANVEKVLRAALRAAREALDDTPNILPVLKEAGVVDAGGKGMLCIYEGMVDGLTLTVEELAETEERPPLAVVEREHPAAEVLANKYCTEFIILGDSLDAELVRAELIDKGDSMIVVGDDDVLKVHIHTDFPGDVLQFCASLGNVTEIAIDNMYLQNLDYEGHRQQHRLNLEEDNVVGFPRREEEKAKPLGLVAVVPGPGLAEIFRSLGVDCIVSGGQTMNPSTEELVKAVDSVNAEAVIILPNNKNVIFSAQQAKELVDKQVGVVATRSTPQGISALMNFVGEDSLQANLEAMEDGMGEVKTGEVTFAVRATVAGDLRIEERDIIGLADGKIAVVGSDPSEVAFDLLQTLIDEDSSVVSIYYGEDQDESEAERLYGDVQEKYPQCEVEVYQGGQPLYYYIVSVE